MGSVFRRLTAVVFLFVAGFATNLSAQNPTYDSLKLVLKTQMPDTNRISALNLISGACEFEDMLDYAQECAAMCEKGLISGKGRKQFYLEGLASSIVNIGFYYSKTGDRTKALANYHRALKIFEQLNQKQEIALLSNNIAVIFTRDGNFSKAMEYHFRNLKVQEEIDDKRGMVYTLNNIGEIYSGLGDYSKGLEYHTKALYIAKSTGDKKQIAQTLSDIGQCYYFLGRLSESLEHHLQAHAKFAEVQDEYGICVALDNIGGTYLKLGDDRNAIEYVTKAIQSAEKYGFKSHYVQSLTRMAELLIRQNKINEALPYAREGLEIAKQIKSPREIWVSARVLKTIFEKQGKFADAYALSKLEIAMHDSLNNETSKKNAMRQELQYEYEKKELQGKLNQERELSRIRLENERKLVRRNVWMYVLISLAVILAISIFFLYKFFKQRNIINASRNEELRRKLLLNQMNPHFIFNSVDNIQSLIHNKQDKEAISYLTKFSKLTRQILENSSEEYISLSEELNTIGNYLTIQQLLYNNNFRFTIEVEASIDQETIFVPPMLTQPFVENAIKHGLKNKTEGGSVQVRFYLKEESLFFEVSDNGSGLEEKIQTGHKSMSTRIVMERLNSNAKKPIAIRTENRFENNEVKGVITTFEIPYICDN